MQAQTGLQFNGSNQYVTFGAAPGLATNSFTIEIWFKRTGTGVSQTTGSHGINLFPLLAKGAQQADGGLFDANYMLGVRDTFNVIAVDFEEGSTSTTPGENHSLTGTTPILNNVWYHAAASYSNGEYRLYLDGELEASASLGSSILPQGASTEHASLATMLNATGGTNGFFQGVLDEARIWNYARSQAEIQAGMGMEITGGAGLLGRWGLNEGTGTTATNSVSGGVNGTLTNGPTWAFPGASLIALETFDNMLPGVLSGNYGWFTDGSGENVTAGTGVASSQGLSTDNSIFNWTEHTFNWGAANLQKVILGMDFQASDAGVFDDDRVAWTTTPGATTSANEFGVQLDNSGGLGIKLYWNNGSAVNVRTDKAALTGIAANGWYRLRVEITKLSATSAQLDVRLIELNSAGDSVSVTASFSIANTADLAGDAPATTYFVSGLSPSFKNYNSLTTGACDNAYFVITTAVAPTIVTTGTLTAFNALPGVPSAAQTYTVSGSNLTADISITPPTGFELSTNGTNYFPSLTLTQTGGTVGSTTVYVRLNSGTVNTYSGNIAHTSSGATTQNVAVTGTVSNTLTATFQEGINSYASTIDNFLRQTQPTTSQGTAATIDWDTEETGGNPATQKFGLLRFDNMFGSGPGQIPVGAIISSATLQYYISNEGDVANVNEVAIPWDESTTWNTFGAAAGVDASDYGAQVATTAGPGITGSRTIDVTSSLAAWSGNPSSNLGWIFRPTASNGVQITSSEGATASQRPLLTVVYEPASGPTISTIGTLTAFSAQPGSPSTAQTYTVSGVNLTANISVTAPTGFELSTNGTSYFSDLTLTQSGGTVSSTTVYVRLNSLTEGSFSGNIAHVSTDATTKNVAVTGEVALINALRLGSGSSYVTFGNNASLALAQVTLETWFRRDGTGATASTGTGGVAAIPLVTKGRGEADGTNQDMNYFLGIRASDNVLAADFEEGAAGTTPGLNHPVYGVTPIANGVWHHAAATYNGNKWQLFLDGNLESELVVGQPLRSDCIQHAGLGVAMTSTGATEGHFDGTFDEVRIWNYARTQSEILSTINLEVPSATGLVGRWALNEGTGTAVHNTAGSTIDGTITGTGWSWTAGAPMTINQAPALPTLIAPANASTGISTSPTLQVSVTDPESNAMTVKFYGRPKTSTPGPDFTIIALPDAQNYTTSDPVVAKFTAQTNWIVAQKDLRNIVYVAMEGDITNDNVDASWQRANTAMSILESPSPGIPYAIAIGNHDQIGSTTALYNNYFGVTRFTGRSYYGGHYGSDNNNNYVLFSASGMDFIAIHFGSGDQAPSTAVLDWADALLKANPTRRAIIVSHSILTSGGTFAAPGTAIYNALSDNPNLFLTLSGHTCYQALKTDTRTGMGPVYSVLSDYQDDAGTGGNGWLRIFTFSPSTNKITVASYSPYATLSNYAGVTPFTLDYTMDGSQPFTLLATNTGVASGATTTFSWPSLGNSTEYEWYTTVSDGNTEVTGPTWSFTTEAVTTGETVTATLPNTPYAFPTMGATVNFGTLPAGGGDVTITRHDAIPAWTPPGGATCLPVWFEITSTLPAHSFSATVAVDVTGIGGFGAQTNVLYYSTGPGQWIPVGGTFDGAHTFTFTTNHLTDFGFAGSTAGAFDLYLGANQNATGSAAFRPNASWDGEYGGLADDWSFTGTQQEVVYVVPEVGAQFGSCNLTVNWDSNVLQYVSVDFAGSILSGASPTVTPQGLAGVNIAANLGSNTTVTAGQYLAKIVLHVIKPGSSGLTVTGCSFLNQPAATSIFVTAHDALHGAYLGDVYGTDGNAGDGKVDGDDLAEWSYAYWSGVQGYTHGMDYYKAKFDIGPTQDGYLFTAPALDGKIDFEDLLIFAMSYNVSARHQIGKIAEAPTEPIDVAAGIPVTAAGETVIPITLGGTVADLRGLSLELRGQFGKFLGVEAGSLLSNRNTPPVIMSTEAKGRLLVDFAIPASKEPCISSSGEILRLRFEGNAKVGVSNALARNSFNRVIPVSEQSLGKGVPVSFALDQNYPNPFNPTTTISYQVPVAGRVTIRIFDVVGREVATLVNEMQGAGYYTVQWNGRSASGAQLASGIYFCRMQADKFTAMNKMLLVK